MSIQPNEAVLSGIIEGGKVVDLLAGWLNERKLVMAQQGMTSTDQAYIYRCQGAYMELNELISILVNARHMKVMKEDQEVLSQLEKTMKLGNF